MIAVVHLVWGPLGPAPLRAFLRSYERHSAGAEHELVVLFNGVGRQERPRLLAELSDFPHRLLELEEPVQDLAAYMRAARLLEHERLCFVNSYSEILADDWLAKLAGALDQAPGGLAGATGSWASARSGALNSLFMPNPYRRVVPERAVVRKQHEQIERELSGSQEPLGSDLSPSDAPPVRSLARSVLDTLRTLPPMPERLIRFPGFPAAHLRTNGFIVDRRLFASLEIGKLDRKMDAYLLESGHRSLTRQVLGRGRAVVVVNRAGVGYEPADWPSSRTLWQGDQEGLLIADNQTRSYANGGLDRRRVLSTLAWGPLADPRLPAQATDHRAPAPPATPEHRPSQPERTRRDGRAARAAVVHLVWGPLGPAPLRAFLRSYERHSAGAEHELVVLFNGVGRQERPRLLAELSDFPHRLLELEEPVQDLAAYMRAARLLEHERLCFVNSYSEILADDWLAKLAGALDQAPGGLVGATGSWASTRSWVFHAYLLPSPYRGLMPPRRVAREQFLAIERERDNVEPGQAAPGGRRTLSESLQAKLRTLPHLPRQILAYEGFPAEHLRTNAFMLERTLLGRLRVGEINSKMDAYALESGRHSLTRQVQAMGRHALVVARDGAVYEERDWDASRTFWQGDQEGLLVADNQTRSYADGSASRRWLLSTFAWGSKADPRPAPPR